MTSNRRVNLPGGTVTFLLTDVESSTRRLEEHADETRKALAHHDGIFEEEISDAGGSLVKTKGEGDSRFAVFERATAAAEAAIKIQRRLRSEMPSPLYVRMAVHTGEAELREDDYYGLEVNRCARVRAIAYGGQVLVSGVTAALLRDAMPAGASLLDLGMHRLKDLSAPEHVFQVCAPDLQDEFPPLLSIDAHPNNLPPQLTTFVGREHQIADVRTHLEEHRLVTLTGIGGCGKTRLALQVAAEEIDHFDDGTFFVDLAPLPEADLVGGAVAVGVGMPLKGSLGAASSPVPLGELVLDYLAHRTCLLVLDNCEHILDASADLAENILSRCPNVRLLATSREPLGLEGERCLLVPSLSLPVDGAPEGSEAVSLFVARAKEVQAAFELTSENASAVAEICRRLDGVPLAIELAAARISHLSPRQIADRLDDMFRLLTGGRRRVQRQQTLQAALDWSYDLLDGHERLLLQRLAVFPATFGLDATEGVCADEELDRPAILDLLGSLVSKSLVVAEQRGAEVGYRLLETVRVYAREKLREAGEAERLGGRHRDWYLAWVESVPEEKHFSHLGHVAFELELDNLRAALVWSASENRPDLVARLAGRLHGLWWIGQHREEGRRWLTEAVEDPGRLETAERVAVFASLSQISAWRLDSRAGEYAQRAIDAASGEPSGPLVMAMIERDAVLVGAAAARRDPELAADARRSCDETIALARSGLPSVWESYALQVRGIDEIVLRDVAAAAEFLEAAEAVVFDRDEYTWLWLFNRVNLILARHLLGEIERPLELAREAQEISEQVRGVMGTFLFELPDCAYAFAAAGDLTTARRLLREMLDEAHGSSLPGYVSEALVSCAAVAFLAGDLPRTARLLGAARDVPGAAGGGLRVISRYRLYRHYVRAVRDALSPEEVLRYRDEGAAMSLDEAVAYAVAEENSARVSPLTMREEQVAGLLAKGLTNRGIAEELVLSERTVDAHLEHIRNKLVLRNRAQIATWVAEQLPRS